MCGPRASVKATGHMLFDLYNFLVLARIDERKVLLKIFQNRPSFWPKISMFSKSSSVYTEAEGFIWVQIILEIEVRGDH